MRVCSAALAKVFISYRRDDTPGYAGRLYDRLKSEFGRDSVFIDVDTLQPGDDFADAINQRLSGCDFMLAVIGRRWATIADERGRPRLEDDNDYVRIEIQSALARSVRTIPVLVERASIPRADDLPEPLRALVRRQSIELSDTRWDYDVGMLVETIRKHLNEPDDRQRPRRPWLPWAAGVAAVLVAALAMALLPPFWRSSPAASGAGAGAPSALQAPAGAPLALTAAKPLAASTPPSSGPGASGVPKVAFTTPAGLLLVPVKPERSALFEEMVTQLLVGLSRSDSIALRQQGEGIRVFRAADPLGANALYVVVIQPARPAGDYDMVRLLQATVPTGDQHEAQTADLSRRYAIAFAGAYNRLSLTPLHVALPPTAAQPATPSVTPPKLSFSTPAGLLLAHVKPDRTADFEELAARLGAGFAKVEDVRYKHQVSGVRLYRASEPSVAGNVLYVVTINPAVPDADYDLFQLLSRTMTSIELQTIQTTTAWKRYAEAFGEGLNKVGLTPVGPMPADAAVR